MTYIGPELAHKELKTVLLHVTITDGRLTGLDGEPLPALQPDSKARLTVYARDLLDPDYLLRARKDTQVYLLPAQTRLLVHLNPHRPHPRNRHGDALDSLTWRRTTLNEQQLEAQRHHDLSYLESMRHQAETGMDNAAINTLGTELRGEVGGFAEIVLLDALTLLLRGSKSAKLQDVRCFIPYLETEADSLNQAYTLLSIRFEPWRRSHSGNVFNKVAFVQSDVWPSLKSDWRTLELLRKHYEAESEERFRTKLARLKR